MSPKSERNQRSTERRQRRLDGEPSSGGDGPGGRRAAKLRAIGVDPQWLVPVFEAVTEWCLIDYKDNANYTISSDIPAEAAAAGIEEMLNAIHRPRAKPLRFEVQAEFDSWAKKTARHAARKHVIEQCEKQAELVIDTSVLDEGGEVVPQLDLLAYDIYQHESVELERCPGNVRFKGKPPECEDIALHPAADRHLRRARETSHDVDYTAELANHDDAPSWLTA